MIRPLIAISRAAIGAYVAAHGAQKLFGVLGGSGLDASGKFFESVGLKPGRELAAVAGASEVGGGLMLATGIADPLGSIAVAGTMLVAGSTAVERGPFATKGGYELPASFFLFAVLAAAAPRGLRIFPPLPAKLAAAIALGAATASGALAAKVITRGQSPQRDS